MTVRSNPEISALLGYVFGWGSTVIGAGSETRALWPWNNNGIPPGESGGWSMEMVSPVAGKARCLQARHNYAGTSAETCTYELVVNDVATGLKATLPTNAIGSASDLVNEAAINVGDRLRMRVTKSGVTSSAIYPTVTLVVVP